MMGFCMGGCFVLFYVIWGILQVVVLFYGGVFCKVCVFIGICLVVGGWGKKDLIYGYYGEWLVGYFIDFGVDYDIKIYFDVGYFYMNDYQMFLFKCMVDYSLLCVKYDFEIVEDSWCWVLVFFEKMLSV